MTDHKATPEQWDILHDWADSGCTIENCLLELRARVEALTLALKDEADCNNACVRNIAERLSRLEGNHPARPDSSSAPAGSLVDRVAAALYAAPSTHEGWRSEARAAIREVAAWLREQEQCVGLGRAVAQWLEQEVNRD